MKFHTSQVSSSIKQRLNFIDMFFLEIYPFNGDLELARWLWVQEVPGSNPGENRKLKKSYCGRF